MNAIIKENESIQNINLRLWPGIVAVVLQWTIRFIIPLIVIDATAVMVGIFGGMFFGLVILIWWAFFSRAPIFERWFATLLMIVSLVLTSQFLHLSIKTANMGLMFLFFSVPVMSLALVGWAWASRNLSIRKYRIISMLVTILLASGFWILLRTDGMTGDARQDFTFRWSKTAEEKFLARNANELNFSAAQDTFNTEAEWPGFRGPNRDGIIHGIKIETDWEKSPPLEKWRKSIGPGCSSFAIHGDFFYTQEQRGEFELVSCYNMTSGNQVWVHNDSTRFWDSHAGAGPRSTPTLKDGRVYTLGATGILNVLNENDGSVIWTRNTTKDVDVKHSGWGYTSSPLVVDDVVFVALVGTLAAYDINSGDPLWFSPDGGDSYSSPHMVNIDSVEQILLMSSKGVTSFLPLNGTVLWNYEKPGGTRIIQPAIINNGNLLIGDGDGSGITCISVSKASGEWKVEELWKSIRLRPNHNDFVIHKGHAYGFDGTSLACIELVEGKRKWKYGRYDGQLLLVADQDLLIVIAVTGEISLISAMPDHFNEIAKIQAIEGKTWNHPVLVNDILMARNTQEMVAYKLNLIGS